MRKSILKSPKLVPFAVLALTVLFFAFSFIKGNLMVRKSEKELSPKKQITEAQAKKYSLKEIDSKTGEIRWQLTATEGTTENNLQAALIKNIKAEVYKNKEVVFELSAPYAKANSSTKEIYLFDNVTATDKYGNFLLKSNQIALGMGTSIEAQKGFNLLLKNSGTVTGDNALINDDQTKIIVKDLKEALFKDIKLSGKEVCLEKEKNGSLTNATITQGGKVILVNQNNDNLSAEIITWKKSGEIEAKNNIIYQSEDKIFKANFIFIKPDKKLYARDNVSIVHGQTQCSGKELVYENNSLIILTGNPRAIQGDKQISADKIVYDLRTSKVEAIGNVKTIVANKQPSNRT